MSEAEKTIARIKNNPNVGFLITDKNNKIVRTNFNKDDKVSQVI